ncbi:MAG: leucine zipper domain-containing protein [Alphaproteobacteria bacterium]
MQTDAVQKCDLAAATRGLIVQRVLVDGWTAAEAGAPFGVDEQSVARWVASYRRRGMAALREDEAVDSAPRRWLQSCLARIGAWLRGGAAKRPADAGGAPARRWRRY